jgi:hypothetical protein
MPVRVTVAHHVAFDARMNAALVVDHGCAALARAWLASALDLHRSVALTA